MYIIQTSNRTCAYRGFDTVLNFYVVYPYSVLNTLKLTQTGSKLLCSISIHWQDEKRAALRTCSKLLCSISIQRAGGRYAYRKLKVLNFYVVYPYEKLEKAVALKLITCSKLLCSISILSLGLCFLARPSGSSKLLCSISIHRHRHLSYECKYVLNFYVVYPYSTETSILSRF